MLDLIGQRYNRWTVLKEAERTKSNKRTFLCKCDCGNTSVVQMDTLRNGNSKSCGCLKLERAKETSTKDLTGSIFGRLTALKIVGYKASKNSNVWLCDCSCGRQTTAYTNQLTSGDTKSCGCLKKDAEKMNIDGEIRARYVEGVSTVALGRKPRKNSSTGVNGVSFDKRSNKYVARIKLDGKSHYLGQYKTLSEAELARKEAEEKLFTPILKKYEENIKEYKITDF
ncbi:AP2 domain-containing protein [Bacillus sp. Marseille-P3800]|uniref:AP2 domain-containing protein n=1 Tax=Bacillus sp. Marseille-P3800 TaxID=2014782 RepID=UPI000C08D013|nr:AP2 domain-containing protein [Bacillus sp. Marseille-P3800]